MRKRPLSTEREPTMDSTSMWTVLSSGTEKQQGLKHYIKVQRKLVAHPNCLNNISRSFKNNIGSKFLQDTYYLTPILFIIVTASQF